MENLYYKIEKIKTSNTLFCAIEETFNDDYSILIHDDYSDYEGGICVEKFAKTYKEAEILADKLFDKILNKLTQN
jgi:hypothetical protein